MDDRTLAMARVLMDRVDDGSVAHDLHGNHVNAMLMYREHRYSEALRFLDQYLDASPRLGARFVKVAPQRANALALRAMLGAELERGGEARRDLDQALAQLKLALGDEPGHDRGDNWYLVDQAEIHLREAKALFQAKGIPLPEPDAK